MIARAAGAAERDERVLLLERRVLSGADPVVTVTVKEQPFEVGVDPCNEMIDRVSRDNRKDIAIQ